ncbi:HNH endonuclease [Saccharopolyspora sp. 6V]|uniref:HNH endonuclease n=1 Tax=Saccharopolyspora sp. 6V TaxID=2877239 RepID=UPI001CD45A9B|nr:HNH endonuclease signature motif containing protein [Saccharopolyspora sp. 6V]MCA1191697.1 HNH endonuclease [Saccharopolyspora sp. 6V]
MSERSARALVYARSGGACERCGHNHAAEWHHRKNRSQGGKWTAANGLHVCSTCHHWITEHPAKAALRGYVVRSWQSPLEVPVRLAWHGVVLLDDCGHWTPSLDLGEAA